MDDRIRLRLEVEVTEHHLSVLRRLSAISGTPLEHNTAKVVRLLLEERMPELQALLMPERTR